MRKMQFVKAADDDLDFLAEVVESILPLYKDLIPGAFERQIQKFRVWRKFPINYEIWLIVNKGEPLGFFGAESLDSEVVYLAAFYLHNDYHRMRLGSMALEEFVTDLRGDGYKELLLFAHQEAYWAVNFYLKHDFEMVTANSLEIRTYKGGILADYFLPKPILMRRFL